MFHLQDQDKTRRSKKHLETASRRETETFQKRIETAVSQFKNTNWWSLSLHKFFFAGQIHYFLHDVSASLMHCTHVHKIKVTRPRPRRYIFKTKMRPRLWTLKTRRDWDGRFFQTLETKTRPRRSTFKTETRPRRSIFSNSQDRDETETFNPRDRDETKTFNLQDWDEMRRSKKNVSRMQCRSLKTPTGEVCHLTTCFLRVRSIIFLHVHKTKVTRPRRYIFKTKTRPRLWTLKTRRDRDRDVRFFQTLETETFNLQDRDETWRDVPKKRLESETFKTETTSLPMITMLILLLLLSMKMMMMLMMPLHRRCSVVSFCWLRPSLRKKRWDLQHYDWECWHTDLVG